jgi:hypothetical protein
MLARMSDPVPPTADPRPTPPKEPELEDCCGSGCAFCVFDAYQIALDNYQRALAAWELRHAGLAGPPSQP